MDFFTKATQSLNEGNKGDLLKQAQGFLSAQQDSEKKTSDAPVPAPADAAATDAVSASTKKNYGEVYSSAQTLYQGIQDKLSGKTDVDNQKLAGAANDVLKAAESSGLIGKDNQYSEYFKKAEGYLAAYAAKTPTTKTEETPAPKT